MASRDAFYVWHFRTAQSWTTLRLDSSNKNPAQNANSKSSERLYHVDDAPGGMHSFFPVKFFTAEKFLLSNFFWSIPPPFEHILLHIHYKMCSKGGVMDQKKFESKNLSAVPLRMIRPRDSSTLN